MRTQTYNIRPISAIILGVAIIFTAVMIALAIPSTGYSAQDEIMDFTADNMTVKLDKNGNEYVRFIVQKTYNLQGTEYTVGVPVMAFGETAQQAKLFEPGDAISVVARLRTYQGRDSYTILKFLMNDE